MNNSCITFNRARVVDRPRTHPNWFTSVQLSKNSVKYLLTNFSAIFFDIDVRRLDQDSDSPLVWVAQKSHGGSPGPHRLEFTSGMGVTSDRMAGLPAEMYCSDWAVAYGGPGSHGSYVEPGSTPF